jgi:hypothetical protein
MSGCYLLVIVILLVSLVSCNQAPGQKAVPTFKKTVLTADFLSEGVTAGDINKDGKMDIIAGYYWFEAPSWIRHEIAPSRVFDPKKEYSNSFLNLCMDVNLDGWTDLVLIDYPGNPGFWFENPKNKPGHWKKYVIADSTGIANESPAFEDIDGDGRPEIICGDLATKQIVWLKAPVKKDDTSWIRYPVSAKDHPGAERFSHGIGYGDINKDGRKDIITKQGWLEAPTDPKQPDWVFHTAELGEDCSHMHAVDVNTDGKIDVVSTSAHKLGIWWYEQLTGADNKTAWKRHLISDTVSQTHATIMTDLNDDGNPDLITGKRYLAHHSNPDPGSFDPPLLVWFEFSPGKTPYWTQHVLDNNSGAGLNIFAGDMNKDGRTDIVIANKKGVFLLENESGKN